MYNCLVHSLTSYDGMVYSSVTFVIFKSFWYSCFSYSSLYGQVFIIRNTTLVYTAADTPIHVSFVSALNTWWSLIGRLSSVIPVIFQAHKKIIQMLMHNHFQVMGGNYEKVWGGNGIAVLSGWLKTIIICVMKESPILKTEYFWQNH